MLIDWVVAYPYLVSVAKIVAIPGCEGSADDGGFLNICRTVGCGDLHVWNLEKSVHVVVLF